MLEIPALLWQKTKAQWYTTLDKQVKTTGSSILQPGPPLWCPCPCLCASAQVLLWLSPSWWGNENKYTPCIWAVILWLFLYPVCAGSHTAPQWLGMVVSLHKLALKKTRSQQASVSRCSSTAFLDILRVKYIPTFYSIPEVNKQLPGRIWFCYYAEHCPWHHFQFLERIMYVLHPLFHFFQSYKKTPHI